MVSKHALMSASSIQPICRVLIPIHTASKRVVLPPPRPKSIREAEKVRLVNRAQNLDDGLLHDLVFHGGDAQRVQFAVRFGDMDSPRGVRSIGPGV